MNITFLVGNGFDMRMGIKSGYKDVEKNYKSIETLDEDIKKFKEELDPNSKYWSNFELAMGKYMGDFKDDEQKIYIKCMNDFTLNMINYLQDQEKAIDFEDCEEEVRKEFSKSLSDIFGELSRARVMEIKRILREDSNLNINFVSFNYTHIIDKCIELSFKNHTQCGKHECKNGYLYDNIIKTNVKHVHGELPESIILGIDNQNQIYNETWKSDKRFCQK